MIDEHQPASSPPHYSPNPSQSLANRKRLNPSIPGQSPLSQERWHHERVKYGVSTATGESFLSPSRSPTKSRVSTSHGATKRGGALTHRKSTPSLPETRNPFRENEERQEPPAPLVGNHEASSCEEIWINNYASDVQRYSSVSLWADLAIAEAATLVDSQTLPANALAAMSAQLLVDMEPKFTPRHGQAVHDAVDDVLNSVFVLTDKDGKPTCEAAKAILERNVVVPRSEQVPHDGIPELDDVGLDQNELVLKHSVFSLGLQGSKKKLQLFMECPTYYDQVRYLWSNLKKEIVVRPPCHRKMQAMRAERQMETRMIKRACDHWAQGIIEVMFSAWKFEVSMSHAREKRGKYMLMMMQLKIGDVFKVWKDYTKENRTFREMSANIKAKQTISDMKIQLKKLNLSNSGGIGENRLARTQAEKAKRKAEDAKAILQMPARQTDTLHRIVKGFNRIYKAFAKFQDAQHDYHIEEMFRVDDDTTRLAPLYKWKSIGPNEESYNRGRRPSLGGRPSDLLDPGKFDGETDCDEADEHTIRHWTPGQFKSVEKTPAFKPFETRAGHRTLRWANNCLRDFRYEHNLPKSKMCRTWTDLEDGSLLEKLLMHLTHKSDRVKLDLKEGQECLAKCHDYMVEKNVEDVSEEFYKENPKVLRCWSLLKYADNHMMGCLRHIKQEHLTNLKRPKTKIELDKHEKRMASLAMRVKETGIVVHVMSQYMGQRIHVLHIHEPMTFAAIAELFTVFFKDCQVMIGEQDYFHKIFNRNLRGDRDKFQEIFDDLSKYGPTNWEHSQLLTMAGKIKGLWEKFEKTDSFLLTQWVKCLDDRLRYRAHLPELVRLVWQSVCTTVLSRKVRTEEDLDDGTYTTVDKLQLMSEFKRNGIANEVMVDEEMVEIAKVLKNRIRDLKRIFGFYAAAGDNGPATSMDNAEFWKFVKDCKLQKDRQKLPSVRVDLIFQACNIDYSLVGADRIASDDGELDPTEWVEGLCRLAMYRYTKGSVAKRLAKMLNDDILPNACSLDIDVFRERLGGDRVKDTLQMHKLNMKPVFVDYAADDQSDGAVDSLESMNATELVTYCREIKLCGAPPLLSERAIKTLFAYCQQEEEEIEDGEAETQSDSEQVYSEFMETNAAIGSQMRPDPYNVLEMRIDQYLNQLVHPVSITLQRFRGRGLKTVERLKELWLEKMQREAEKKEGGGGGGGGSRRPSIEG